MKTHENNSILHSLRQAIEARNADVVEDTVSNMFRTGIAADYGTTLVEILDMPWHRRHEDIARALQELKPSYAVPALLRAAEARHDYLTYDEFFGLARKCTWALADIGTVEAKAALHVLSQSDNELIAGYAQKRLNNWDQEQHRKGAAE